MLSIIPYERGPRPDTPDRPFKTYPRTPVSLQHPSLYPPFSQLSGAYSASKISGSFNISSSSMDNRSQSADSHTQGNDNRAQGADNRAQGADNLAQRADNRTQGMNNHAHGMDNPGTGMDTRTLDGTQQLDPYNTQNNLLDMPPGPGNTRGMYKQEPNTMYPPMHNGLSGHIGYPLHPYMNHHNPHTGTGNGMPDPTLPDLPSANNTPSPADMMLSKQQHPSDMPYQSGNTIPCLSSTTNRSLGSPTDNRQNSGPSQEKLSSGDPSTSLSPPIKAPPKKRPHSIPDNQKDSSYWERRKKNNDAAKRSRDGRRVKEQQTATRLALLENENVQLRAEASLIKSEIEKLRSMIYAA